MSYFLVSKDGRTIMTSNYKGSAKRAFKEICSEYPYSSVSLLKVLDTRSKELDKKLMSKIKEAR